MHDQPTGSAARHANPFDDDVEDPSDEPWSIASQRRKAAAHREAPSESD
jgi:hypothetical protein